LGILPPFLRVREKLQNLDFRCVKLPLPLVSDRGPQVQLPEDSFFVNPPIPVGNFFKCDFVDVNSDYSGKSVSYENLIAILVEGIKEQNTMIKDLQNRIAILERANLPAQPIEVPLPYIEVPVLQNNNLDNNI